MNQEDKSDSDIPTSEHSSEESCFESAATQPKQVLLTDEELKGLQRDLFEYKDKYLRLLADMENAKKRLQKERQEIGRLALERFIVDVLRPIDNFENALKFAQHMPDPVKDWAIGFQMILAQFQDALAQHGICAMNPLGQLFNPHEHEAVEAIESSSHPEGIILEECMRGYKMGDRTIRAARVKVAKGASSPEGTTSRTSDTEI